MNDLLALRDRGGKYVEQMKIVYKASAAETAPPADAEVVLVPMSREDAGPYEIDELVAIHLALEHRLDLRVANGVGLRCPTERDCGRRCPEDGLDAERVAASGLGPATAMRTSASISAEARYSALLSLDLPIERTRERNNYRNSLIHLERTTRSVQILEDQIKTSIRSELRTLLEVTRESQDQCPAGGDCGKQRAEPEAVPGSGTRALSAICWRPRINCCRPRTT